MANHANTAFLSEGVCTFFRPHVLEVLPAHTHAAKGSWAFLPPTSSALALAAHTAEIVIHI